MRIVLLFIFGMFLSHFCAAQPAQRVYFTPSDDCENNIIALIEDAQSQIDIAVYAINNDAIVEALKEAFLRDVSIRVLTDRTQAGQKSSKVADLENFGIDVIRHKKYRIQHDKFAIFDKKKIVTGSYNWTNSASRRNAENCLFITKPKTTIQKYQKRFNDLWLMNKKAKRKSKFSNLLTMPKKLIVSKSLLYLASNHLDSGQQVQCILQNVRGSNFVCDFLLTFA